MQRTRPMVLAATLALILCPALARAQHPVPPASGIWSGSASYALSAPARRRLLASLKRITGIDRLAFTVDGQLEVGDVSAHEGSATAAGILRAALGSGDTFVLEDHPNSDAVNFGQIEGMDYINDATRRRGRVWWIRLDFDDFRRIDASPRVRAAFDEGFTVLHELLHALGCHDGTQEGELGECETILNEAREEIGLPIRISYLATSIRKLAPNLAIVRLRFEEGPLSHRDRREQDLFFALSKLAPAASTAAVRQRAQ